MKITQNQLRQIIKEELMRDVSVGAPGMMGSARDGMMGHETASTPPNLGLAESMDVACGTCVNFCPDTNVCMAFGDYPVEADLVCEAWQPEY